jgi:hypothetical protein
MPAISFMLALFHPRQTLPRKFSDEIFSGIDLGKKVFSLDRCRSISLA